MSIGLQLTAEVDAKVPSVLSSDHSYVSPVVLLAVTQFSTSASAKMKRLPARRVVRSAPPESDRRGGSFDEADTRT